MSSQFRFILALGLTTLVFSACQQSSGNLYGYDFNTAKITYSITGSSTGSSEVLIKGEKKKIHNQITQTKADGSTQTIDTILILDGDKLYNLDALTKKGSTVKQPIYAELQKLSPEERKQQILLSAIRDTRSPEEIQKNPPKPEKTENIAGHQCDSYKVGSNLQTCIWQGVPLKAVASLPDYGINTETIATSVTLNQEITDSEFDVPKDYQITAIN